MRHPLLLLLLLCSACLIHAQSAEDCTTIRIDLTKGTVNKLKLNASQQTIKAKLNCFTGDTPDGSTYNCGGGVFYGRDQFYFYSGRDYVNARKGFTGTLSIPVLEKSATEALALLGEPVRTEKAGERLFYFFKRKYGSLVIKVENDKVSEVFMYNVASAEVKLCL